MNEIVLSASRFGLYLSVGFLVGLLPTLRLVVIPGFADLADRQWSARRALVGRRLEQGVAAAAALAVVASAAALAAQILQFKNFLAAPLGEAVGSVVTSSYGLWTTFRIPAAVLLAVLLIGGISARVSGDGGVPPPRAGAPGDRRQQHPGEGGPAQDRGWWLLWAALAAFLLLSMSMTGHPAGASPVWLAVPVDSLHMASATTWLTGLAVLAMVLPMAWSGRNDKAKVAVLAPTIGRFAGLASGSVLVAMATGAASTLLIVNDPGELLDSGYGDALAVKLWTFVWILAFAAVNHFVLVKRLRQLHDVAPGRSPAAVPGAAAKTRRPAAHEVREQRASTLAAVAMNLAAELIGGVLVLVATVNLVSQIHP